MVIASDIMRELFEKASRIARSDEPVLILGETGTGKEILARYIHEHSNRKNRPFLPINCAAIPDHLIESELFGYKKGAFTDAYRDKEGLLAMARGGTVFLDEIGELPLSVQTKLLRAIESQEILPLGATTFQKVNFRLIAATNRDLFLEKEKGGFRSDLFYRLGVFILEVPPLRERLEEIPAFVEFFLREMGESKEVDPRVYERLMCHTWPGNVRELREVLENVCALERGPVVTAAALQPWLAENLLDFETADHGLSLKEMERRLIESTFWRFGGNRERTARCLHIGVRTLSGKLRQYGYPPRGGPGSNRKVA